MKTDLLYSIFRDSKGVSTDSRAVGEGEMFFALWGGKFNGNEYAAEALKKGALCAVIDDPAYENDKTVLVDDCLLELQALATRYRNDLNIPVLAVTGTNGKTTTKELITAVLSKKKKIHSTRGNLNNHIGVPLTLLSAPPDTEMMIIEMGANHPGEIRNLCQIARPGYGIITNIGKAHIEGFGSFEGVVKAKSELFEYLKKKNGIALYNDRDHILSELIYKIVLKAVPFSDPYGIDLRIENFSQGLNLKIRASYMNHSYEITTGLFGSHNIENVRAAVATGLFFELEMDDIADALSGYVPSNNRSEIRQTERNTLICDSYNANPTSMISAIAAFEAATAERKTAILGDMLELGVRSAEEHAAILELILLTGASEIILVGPQFTAAAGNKDVKTFLNAGELCEWAGSNPISGSLVLVKGSRGIGLEKVYPLL